MAFNRRILGAHPCVLAGWWWKNVAATKAARCAGGIMAGLVMAGSVPKKSIAPSGDVLGMITRVRARTADGYTKLSSLHIIAALV